jgi:hypothetical protein
VAGYSGTPLATKLGLGDGMRLALLDPPADLVLDLPPNVTVTRQARGRADVVLAFFTGRAKLVRRMDALAQMVFPAGGLWIAWPKKASGVVTDMTDDAVRAVALPKGLVDNKVCAVDSTWSALRLVWRRENRVGQAQTGPIGPGQRKRGTIAPCGSVAVSPSSTCRASRR